MYIGAHVSIAGGLAKSIDRIVSIGGSCLMTFASSPRSLKFKDFTQEQIDLYLTKKSKHKIGPHFFHGIYLVNLASANKSHLKLSMDSLINYQQLAGKILGEGTIFHIGSSKSSPSSETVSQIVSAVNYILDSSPNGTKLILENAAGQGNTIGKKLDELAAIIDRVGNRSKIGVCLDTQHLFASGVSLDKALDLFDHIINLKYLSLVHVNDSKTPFASNVDRHENLGKGQIPLQHLKMFLTDTRLKKIPLILEVPGIGEGPRKSDIDDLYSILHTSQA